MATDFSFCIQRSLAQMYKMPLTRFTPTNPYSSGYTKQQLDMRRKVEVLKYNSNKLATQTNNLTKKEKFALLVKNGLSRSQAVIQSNVTTCSGDTYDIYTPTYNCDVPGPVTYLYETRDVPLYNYSDFNARTYSNNVPTNSDPWQFVVHPDVLVFDNGTSDVYHLIINNSINDTKVNYTISMPIGLSIAGDSSCNGTIKITSAILQIYYGDKIVKTNSITNSLAVFDVSLNVPTNNPFSETTFLGNLKFNNVELYTAPTYVYKFVLNPTFDVSFNRGVVNKIALIANMSSSNNVHTSSSSSSSNYLRFTNGTSFPNYSSGAYIST